MKHYFIIENGQQSGPFTVDDLGAKKIRKSTSVWTDGMPEWASADSVDELKDLVIAEPPPFPQTPSPPPYNASPPQQQQPQPQTPPHSQPPPTSQPQSRPLFDKDFLSGSGGMLAGTIGVILFSLLDWVNLSVFGYHLKFNLFSLAEKINSSFFREIFGGSEQIALFRIIVVILVIALILSFAMLIIALAKPQMKSASALAYCGFGLCAIVTGIFIVAMLYITAEIEHWVMTVFPFLTVGAAIVTMIFFVKRPAKINFSNIAREFKGEELLSTDYEQKINTKKRHDIVTVWLWLLIASNCITILLGYNLPTFSWIAWFFSFLNIGCVYLLFKDKKNGFWGLCIIAIIGMFVGFANYRISSMFLIFTTAMSIGINYAIFQIRNNGVTFWSKLENTRIDDDIKEIAAKLSK